MTQNEATLLNALAAAQYHHELLRRQHEELKVKASVVENHERELAQALYQANERAKQLTCSASEAIKTAELRKAEIDRLAKCGAEQAKELEELKSHDNDWFERYKNMKRKMLDVRKECKALRTELKKLKEEQPQ